MKKPIADRYWAVTLLFAVLAAVLVVGCGGGDDGGGEAQEEPAATPAATEASEGEGKTQLEMKTIGIMGPVDAAEIIKLGTDATQTAAEALGWDTVRVDPQGDPAKMASGMNSLVNSNVDAIVLTIIEPATIQAGLRAAEAKGIPVINTLTVSHDSPLFAGTYWPDAAEENDLMTARMREDLPEGAKIGMIQLPQFRNAEIAQELFVESAEAEGWEIVARHDTDLLNLVPDVNKAAGDMIRANPDLDAIWGCCDFTAAGAVPAVQGSGKDITVYSVHGIPSSIQFAETGLAVLQIADYQKGSFIAIDQLAKHWTTGEPIPKETPEEFAFQMTIVDESNASEGYPYPTEDILADFKARWDELYILPSE